MEKRVCTKCGLEKDVNEYFLKKSDKDGISYWCKSCCKEYNRSWRDKNKNKLNKYNESRGDYFKKYYIENKYVIDEYRSKYYQDNKEKLKENESKYYKENKYKLKEKRKKYYENNKSLCNINTQRYNSKKRKLTSTLTLEQWNHAKEYFNNRCAYCGEEKPLTQEHFIPVSKGGCYTQDNIIPCCKSCNCSKGNKGFEDWYYERSYYSEERKNKIYIYLQIHQK